MKLIHYRTPQNYVPTFNHSRLLDEVDRLFELGFPSIAPASGAFALDLYQDKEAVHVRAELPGFRREDLDVQVADDTLTITGRLTSAGAEGQARTERAVERAVSLPENLDYAKVSAQYENGVLTVRLPKREEVKPTKVTIEIK